MKKLLQTLFLLAKLTISYREPSNKTDLTPLIKNKIDLKRKLSFYSKFAKKIFA